MQARTGCILACMAAALTAGCQDSPWPKRQPLTPAQAQAINEIAARQQQLNEANEGAFRGETWNLGAIPWNATVLPLPSPDGRWIATSTGTPPSNATRLALPGARPPVGTAIEIWEVLPGYGGVRPQGSIDLPVLMTDSADEEGFLVEAPQPNGSRWIGKADWRTGEVAWLVKDDQVNTMPSLGPRGRLAWSTRARDERLFSLAIRFADGREFGLPSAGDDWLMPVWSTRSDRLSVWRLTDRGILSLVSLDGTSSETLTRPARHVLVLSGASRWDAVAANANRATRIGLPPPPVEEVVFYEPVEQRMTVWMPTGINSDQLISLAPGSIDAIHDDQGDFLLTMSRGLHWQHLGDLRNIVRVDHAAVFPRATTDPMRPFLLLDPGAEVVRLRGMRPRHDAPGTPAGTETSQASGQRF